MAGAGNSINGLPKTGSEDGVLTSKEISSLDFTHLDLAVLSACETALGEIGSEGVFGLQRAFKKAGAHTLLMSLKKVDLHKNNYEKRKVESMTNRNTGHHL